MVGHSGHLFSFLTSGANLSSGVAAGVKVTDGGVGASAAKAEFFGGGLSARARFQNAPKPVARTSTPKNAVPSSAPAPCDTAVPA